MARRDHHDKVLYLFRGTCRMRHLILILLGVILVGISIPFIISNYLLSRHMVVIELQNSRQVLSPNVENLVNEAGGLTGADGYNIPFFKKTYEDVKWSGPTNVNWTQNEETLRLCPAVPPNLAAYLRLPRYPKNFHEIEHLYPNLEKGGHYKPPNCRARHRIAIIIPYRNREKHLKLFLEHMHNFLQKQQLDYVIFVVELVQGVPFNRALLMNIGYAEAVKLYDFQCFVFHDIDLLPENGRNIYSCPLSPRHMSVAVSTLNYRLPYSTICGGAVTITKEHFELINGFSNLFFGWGGEDDDMYNRIVGNGLHLSRYTPDIARYKMLSHKKDTGNPLRFKLLDTGPQRWKQDGINSLKYNRLKIDFFPLYTKILVAYPTLNTTSANSKNNYDVLVPKIMNGSEKLFGGNALLSDIPNTAQRDFENSVSSELQGTMKQEENSRGQGAGNSHEGKATTYFSEQKTNSELTKVGDSLVASGLVRAPSENEALNNGKNVIIENKNGNVIRNQINKSSGTSVQDIVTNDEGEIM